MQTNERSGQTPLKHDAFADSRVALAYKLKPGLVGLYDVWSGNRLGLFICPTSGQ